MANVPRPLLVTRIPRTRAATEIGPPDLVTTTLKSLDKFFGAAGMGPDYEWPNPRGYVPAITLRTWTQSYNLNLFGNDTFFGGAGQPPAY